MSAAAVRTMQSQGIREIIVKRDAGLTSAQQSELRAQAGITYVGPGPLPGTELDQAPAGELTAAVAALERDPQVQYVEPNGEVHAASRPNDQYFGLQWALSNTGQSVSGTRGTAGDDIGASAAWAYSTGAGVTVAVVDSGGDYTAPDLRGQLDSGVDYVDPTNAAQDQDGHGTHVSGIIDAIQNNGQGVSGIAPGSKVLPLRVLDSTGAGSLDDVAAAFNYAGDHNIPIVNASLGGAMSSQTLADAVISHPGTLYVVAAGNGDPNTNIGYNVDSSPFYPCDLAAANLICVGASDQNDGPAGFSNYGPVSVDLFAPGVNILSTYLGGYAYADGTSMAAPMVSGTLALMLADNPSLTAVQLKSDLLASVRPIPQLAGLSVTGGELDAAAAVASAGNTPVAASPPTSPAGGGTGQPAPTVQHSPVRRHGISLSHVAVRAHALVFTLSARARVQIRLRGAAGGVLQRALTGRRGANRYALSSLLRGRHLLRGHYALTVRVGNRVVTLRLNVG